MHSLIDLVPDFFEIIDHRCCVLFGAPYIFDILWESLLQYIKYSINKRVRN